MSLTTVIAVTLAAIGAGHGAGAEDAPPPDAPALNTRRYPEDYRGLRTATGESPWWLRFKDRSVGSFSASFGLELRGQKETFRGRGLGTEPDGGLDYVWWRALPTLDVRNNRARAFAQGIFAFASGLDEEPAPIDVNRADWLQGFVELYGSVGDVSVQMRAGRQLLALGSQRLVGFRYGPNVPLAFEGVFLSASDPDHELRAFWSRPVEAEAGTFDDSADEDETLFGLYWTAELPAASFDAYYLGHRSDESRFDQGVADEERHTLGLRWFGQTGDLDWNAELMGQLGDFGPDDIRAWSATAEAGVRLSERWFEPRLLGRASIISGDSDPDDDVLGTFNPLYPRGKYFGEIGAIGPYNLIDGLVGCQWELPGGWSIELSTTSYWRESKNDGVYANNGALLRSGRDQSDRWVGYQGDVAVTRTLDRGVSWTVGYSRFFSGDFVEATGPDEDVEFFQLSARLLF